MPTTCPKAILDGVDELLGVLSVWMQERQGQPADPLFPTSRGRSLSRDVVALRMDKYARIAAQECPTLRDKAVSPHTFRHSCAMNLLRSGLTQR